VSSTHRGRFAWLPMYGRSTSMSEQYGAGQKGLALRRRRRVQGGWWRRQEAADGAEAPPCVSTELHRTGSYSSSTRLRVVGIDRGLRNGRLWQLFDCSRTTGVRQSSLVPESRTIANFVAHIGPGGCHDGASVGVGGTGHLRSGESVLLGLAGPQHFRAGLHGGLAGGHLEIGVRR